MLEGTNFYIEIAPLNENAIPTPHVYVSLTHKQVSNRSVKTICNVFPPLLTLLKAVFTQARKQ